MLDSNELERILKLSGFQIDIRLRVVLYTGMLVGLLGLTIGLALGYALPVYRALLVNTLFFTGLAHGSLLISAILAVTKAGWGRPIKRFAESVAFFIPISWLLFGVLLTGMDTLFVWTDPSNVVAAKAWWLNVPFFVLRNCLLILLTGLIGLFHVGISLKPDLILLQENVPELSNRLSKRMQHIIGRSFFSTSNQNFWAALFAAFYTIFSCLIAFDWIMSIDQHWVSSVFGFQYAIANFYAAGAFLLIFSSLVRRKWNMQSYLTLNRHNDLSRLVFALSLGWTYLVFSQVLVIWYANLPEETSYLLLRLSSHSWTGLFYLLFAALFLLPFFGFLGKKVCRSPLFSSLVAGVVLIGLWLEKYYLVVPSLPADTSAGVPSCLGVYFWDITITIGMGTTFLYLMIVFLRTFPLFPVADELFNDRESPVTA